MLNSNFDLRTFLAESKAPTEQVNEATLTEATVMEYIREKMDHMNNEVRSCMREYLNAVNEIDPGHEDAHAQLMGALEDFYNKLKAHFESDEAEMEEPLATTEPAPSRELDASPMYEGEEEGEKAFGGEEDELSEGAWEDKGQDPELNKERLADAKAAKAAAEEAGAPVGLLAVMDKYIKELEALNEPKELSPFEKRLAKLAAAEKEKRENNPRYAAASKLGLEEGTIDEDVDPLLLQGLAKTVLHLAAVPGFMAVLYKLKDTKKFGPAIQKMITALEKFHD